MTFTEQIRRIVNLFKLRLLDDLSKTSLQPNHLTAIGLCGCLLAGLLAWAGQYGAAAILFFAASLTDALDGALAKRRDSASKFGVVWDASADRWGESFLLMGVGLSLAADGRTGALIACFLAWIGATMVSYTRARAELVIPQCQVGFLERPERVCILAIGLLSGRVSLALWLVAVLGHLTAFDRLAFVYEQTACGSPTARRLKKIPPPLRWNYPRYSVPYDIYLVVLLILFLITPAG